VIHLNINDEISFGRWRFIKTYLIALLHIAWRYFTYVDRFMMRSRRLSRVKHTKKQERNRRTNVLFSWSFEDYVRMCKYLAEISSDWHKNRDDRYVIRYRSMAKSCNFECALLLRACYRRQQSADDRQRIPQPRQRIMQRSISSCCTQSMALSIGFPETAEAGAMKLFAGRAINCAAD